MLAELIAAIAPLLPAGTESLIGAKHIAANGAPPRVVWVPTDDKFSGARQHGTSQRALLTRNAGCAVHIWAKDAGNDPEKDLAAAEELLRATLEAIHTVAFGSYEVTGGGWLGADGQELTQLGRAYVLELVFQVPITEAAPTTQTIDIAAVQGGMTFPSGDVADNSEAP